MIMPYTYNNLYHIEHMYNIMYTCLQNHFTGHFAGHSPAHMHTTTWAGLEIPVMGDTWRICPI